MVFAISGHAFYVISFFVLTEAGYGVLLADCEECA
jgi:hypothetical protein